MRALYQVGKGFVLGIIGSLAMVGALTLAVFIERALS